MEPKLIKIDRNGSKHYEGLVTCDRCGGHGYYAVGMHNDRPILSPWDGGVCWKCGGAGKVRGKWIERTPEYQAKLDARREAKRAAEQAKLDAERAEREAKAEAERIEREAKIKALKAVSQYVGEVGERMTIKATYERRVSFEVPSFGGWGTETMHIHIFKDANGNVLVWKTSKSLYELDDVVDVVLTGTVKEHSEYNDEKQTVLTRCKVSAAG